MSKRKLTSFLSTPPTLTNENEDGWLSTRNKKKISPAPLKAAGRTQSLHRGFPRSPFLNLTENCEEPILSSMKKQTTIADFFSTRLKDLPPRDDSDQEFDHRHAADEVTTFLNEEEGEGPDVYADYDIQAPTPSQVKTASHSVSQHSISTSMMPTSPGKTTHLPHCKISDIMSPARRASHSKHRDKLFDEQNERRDKTCISKYQTDENEMNTANQDATFHRHETATSVDRSKLLVCTERMADSLYTPYFLEETRSPNTDDPSLMGSYFELEKDTHKPECFTSSPYHTPEQDNSFTNTESINFTFSHPSQCQTQTLELLEDCDLDDELSRKTITDQSLVGSRQDEGSDEKKSDQSRLFNSQQIHEHDDSMMTQTFLSSQTNEFSLFSMEERDSSRQEEQQAESLELAVLEDLETPDFLLHSQCH